MTDFSYDGNTRVMWVPTIADKTAPTVAQLAAGTLLSTSDGLTKDGLQLPTSQNFVDSGALSETFDAQDVGTEGGNITLKIKKSGTVPDAFWDLFAERGEVGFLVVRYGLPNLTAVAAGQEVQVYPAKAHSGVMDNTTGNARATFTVGMAVTSEPAKNAVVAA